jgi:hypothetical protein
VRKTISVIAVAFLVASCSLSGFEESSQFKERWNDSLNHTVVSWWYIGETNEFYFIKEKWGIRSYNYELPKSQITIKNVPTMAPCSFCEGINLKANNVKFNEAKL